MNEFDEKLGFPQCAGVVDGTHIPIASPEECPADYFNRKGWHSILMQGMVDHMGRFTEDGQEGYMMPGFLSTPAYT